MATRQRKKPRAETMDAAASLDRLYEILKPVMAQPPPAGWHTISEVAEAHGIGWNTAQRVLEKQVAAGLLQKRQCKPAHSKNLSWFYGPAE